LNRQSDEQRHCKSKKEARKKRHEAWVTYQKKQQQLSIRGGGGRKGFALSWRGLIIDILEDDIPTKYRGREGDKYSISHARSRTDSGNLPTQVIRTQRDISIQINTCAHKKPIEKKKKETILERRESRTGGGGGTKESCYSLSRRGVTSGWPGVPKKCGEKVLKNL